MTLSWDSIFRIGLLQLCPGATVVLTTATLNRLLVVEFALPAVLPGLLVGLHCAIQITRPTWRYRSDTGGNRTRFILLGMVVLALAAFLAAAGMIGMGISFAAGLALSILAYSLVGAGFLAVAIATMGQMVADAQVLLIATVALGVFNGIFAVAATRFGCPPNW